MLDDPLLTLHHMYFELLITTSAMMLDAPTDHVT